MNAKSRLLNCLLLAAAVSMPIVRDCDAQEAPVPQSSPKCEIFNLPSLVGAVSLSLGKEQVVRRTMPCFITLWQKLRNRGSGDFDVSNAFLTVMEGNPAAFFSVMANEPNVFKQWLEDLPNLSFTWADAPPCGLETKRKQLIAVLQQARVDGEKASALKIETIRRLSAIRCRQIN